MKERCEVGMPPVPSGHLVHSQEQAVVVPLGRHP